VTPVVTGLRDAGHGSVAVELDGSSWRVLPGVAVVRAGLVVGMSLDRPSASRLNRELRRSEALGVAVGVLRQRDHSRRSLQARLGRRGVASSVSEDALAALERAGLVDDVRTARTRATSLAERDAGDLLIREDLERRGYAPEHIEAAIAELEPEAGRVERIVSTRGASTRTLRKLAARGFAPESLEDLVAEVAGDALG